MQPADKKHLYRRPWWVVFGRSTMPHWWDRFIDAEFGHVFAWTEYPGTRQVIVIDPAIEGLVVNFPSGSSAELVELAMSRNMRVLFTHVDRPSYTLTRRWLIMNCATVASYAMGLPVAPMTPKQLYRWLINHGATIID